MNEKTTPTQAVYEIVCVNNPSDNHTTSYFVLGQRGEAGITAVGRFAEEELVPILYEVREIRRVADLSWDLRACPRGRKPVRNERTGRWHVR